MPGVWVPLVGELNPIYLAAKNPEYKKHKQYCYKFNKDLNKFFLIKKKNDLIIVTPSTAAFKCYTLGRKSS